MISTTDFETALVSPEFIADPYPTLRLLREREPVYWSESLGGWVLTRYDDIAVTFKDTARFSNENRLGQGINHLPPEKRAALKPFSDHFAAKSLLHSDPPDHTRLRGVVGKEFNLAMVQRMRPRIQEVIKGFLDAAEDKGRMDIVADLAAPLPIGVVSEILGVPASDRHLFRRWAGHVLTAQGVNKPSEAELSRAQGAIMEMRPYIAAMIEERRRKPRDDMMSKFAAVESSGGPISENELITTCVTLFVAGHETTVALISNSLFLLLSHPEQLGLLQEDSNLINSTIEESLRFESPISRQPRRVKVQAQLGGKTLQEGQIVMQMLNAANRDPAHFDEPDVFDVRRRKNRHMAFGQGVHTCVGAPLARAEALIAVAATVRRFPKLRLVDSKPDWDLTKRSSRIMNTLPVLF